MKSLKFYKILSITLVILNLITLGFLFFNRPPGPPPRGEARLAQDIGLSGELKKKVDALEIQHHKDKRKLMKENFLLQQKLYDHLSDSESSQVILTKVHANRTEIDRMTFEFFSDVAELCNEDQRKNLDAVIEHRLRRITNLPRKR